MWLLGRSQKFRPGQPQKNTKTKTNIVVNNKDHLPVNSNIFQMQCNFPPAFDKNWDGWQQNFIRRSFAWHRHSSISQPSPDRIPKHEFKAMKSGSKGQKCSFSNLMRTKRSHFYARHPLHSLLWVYCLPMGWKTPFGQFLSH